MNSFPLEHALARPTGAENTKRCDLCDGERFELISSTDRHGAPLETVLCARCGLIAHARIPTEGELSEFYSAHYRNEYHGETTPSARRVVRAWENGQRIARRLAPYTPASGRVLEVGAGIGCTVKAFELKGFNAEGIDPGLGFQEYARVRLKARVGAAQLFDLDPTPSHDLILLVHVIEHLRSPRRSFEHMRRMLRPNGRLYVECPNFAAPFARRSRLFHFAHIHNFTPSTLAMLAEACGFKVERVFSSDRDPNLQMLLTLAETREFKLDSNGYVQSLDGLKRSSSVAYHLRPSYFSRRASQLLGYAREYLTARTEQVRIEALCAARSVAGGQSRDAA